jgi:hypothetical protein
MQRLLHMPDPNFTSYTQRASEFVKNVIDIVLKTECTNVSRKSSPFISATKDEALWWKLYLDWQKSVA